MFDTQNIAALEEELNAFCVPMFVVQTHGKAPFSRIAANRLFRTQAPCTPDDLGIPLPGLGADEGEACCVDCCAGKSPIHYSITSPSAPWPQRISMVPLSGKGVASRIVITLQPAEDQRSAFHRARTLEDASYFAFHSEFQIARALAFVEAMQLRQVDGKTRADLLLLAGLCRSAERGVMDVRRAVEPLLQPASTMAGAPTALLPADQPPHHCLSEMPHLFQMTA